MATINKNLSYSKRKPELLLDGAEVVEKRKKGRPRKDKMAAPIAQPFTQVKRLREKMNGWMDDEEMHSVVNIKQKEEGTPINTEVMDGQKYVLTRNIFKKN